MLKKITLDINKHESLEDKELKIIRFQLLKKSNFSVQFKGKNPADFKLAVKKDGGDVDAITASTISSRAFTKAVENAYNILQAMLAGKAQVEGVSGATKTAN